MVLYVLRFTSYVLRVHLRNRSAFPITTKSDRPIAAAHRIGLMNPSAASGTPTALWKNAQKRFCLIVRLISGPAQDWTDASHSAARRGRAPQVQVVGIEVLDLRKRVPSANLKEVQFDAA